MAAPARSAGPTGQSAVGHSRWDRWADDDAGWGRARQWAEATPDWSDQRWRKINAHLRYRVVEGGEARDASA